MVTSEREGAPGKCCLSFAKVAEDHAFCVMALHLRVNTYFVSTDVLAAIGKQTRSSAESMARQSCVFQASCKHKLFIFQVSSMLAEGKAYLKLEK